MGVVQVDHLDTQPQQRGVAGAQHVVPGTADAACPVSGAAVDAELGGQLHLIPAAVDGPAHQHLVVPGAVGVGGVQERDAQLQGPVDGGQAAVPVGGAVALAHPHAPQTHRADGETGRAERGSGDHARILLLPDGPGGTPRADERLGH